MRACRPVAFAILLALGAVPAVSQEAPQPGRGYSPLVPGGGGFNPLAPAGPPAGASEAYEAAAEFGGLPRSEGVEETYYLCGSCHSLRLVTSQRLTPARWDEVLDWMVEAQGMPEQTAEDRARILGYLARHFSSAAP